MATDFHPGRGKFANLVSSLLLISLQDQLPG
jgi:hypothetical protein